VVGGTVVVVDVVVVVVEVVVDVEVDVMVVAAAFLEPPPHAATRDTSAMSAIERFNVR
jgi:hypothetical protein